MIVSPKMFFASSSLFSDYNIVISNRSVSRRGVAAAHSSESSRVLFPSEPVSLLSSMAFLSISSSSYAASRLFIVARRLVLIDSAFCFDFPSLLLTLSGFDDDEEGSGEKASRTGRYREERGLIEHWVLALRCRANGCCLALPSATTEITAKSL